MNANECGLGAFAIGIMLLTHPERLKHYDDLWIGLKTSFCPVRVFVRYKFIKL
jgi:hypothetical protein